MSTPKEIPVLFSTNMVKAILAGNKTQTRRIVKPQPNAPRAIYNSEDCKATMGTTEQHAAGLARFSWKHTSELGKVISDGGVFTHKCPYGKVGDVIWVREGFGYVKTSDIYYYKSDIHQYEPIELETAANHGMKWKPSIHMPKAAARIWLEITDIRVERLQDIEIEDAKAEGLEPDGYGNYKCYDKPNHFVQFPIMAFRTLWESINGAESWKANPWVWVVEFKVLSTTGKPTGNIALPDLEFEEGNG